MKHHYLSGLVMLLLFTSLVCYSQSPISYSYDAAGNRTARTISLSKKLQTKVDSTKSNKEEIKDEVFNPENVKIYPNPSKGLVEIEVEESDNDLSPMRITVLNMNGKVIIDKSMESLRSAVDISGQADGIYILILRKSEKVSRWKIIKQ